MLALGCLAGVAVLLALFSLRGDRRCAAYVRERLTAAPHRLPLASVIVPVKGHDEGLRENLAALAALDYPDYELIVVARTAADIPPGALPARAKVVLAHGDRPTSSEKVQNLSAAVRAIRKDSEVLAFADSDGRVTVRWLRALVAPLDEPGVGASTGYRWFMPQPATLWSLVRAVWDAVAAGLFGPADSPFAWGGAMAIRKATFQQARVPDSWQNAVSDDYALSAAVHAAGLRIAYAPGALTPSLDHTTAWRFLEWSRRQAIVTRFHNPALWRAALAAHVVYCTGMTAGLILCVRGHWAGAALLAAQLLPGMWKGARRTLLARAALPEYAGWFRRWGWIHAAGTPLATWLWLVALAMGGLRSSIVWRGYRYDFKRRRSL